MNLKITYATLALAGFSVVSQAQVMVATESQTNGTSSLPHTFVPSTTDLINGLTASAPAGNFNQEGTGGVPVLTDGLFPSPITRATIGDPPTSTGFAPFQFEAFATGGNTGGTSITYTLTTPSDITEIDIYGGWQDGGRDQQSYSILYATALSPLVFIPLTTVDFNPPGSVTPQVTRVQITDATGLLAANVAALQFNFNATENGYAGYAEIDVIPEPTTFGLLGFSTIALLANRRRR